MSSFIKSGNAWFQLVPASPDAPPEILANCVSIVNGRYIQADKSWFEKTGENSFCQCRFCPRGCGSEQIKKNGYYVNCSCLFE